MRQFNWILSAILVASLALAACSKPEPAPVEDPAAAEEQRRLEEEKARRAEAVQALDNRLESLEGSIQGLVDSAQSADLPSSLADSTAGLSAKLSEVKSLQAELSSAAGDAWETARQRLDAALGELESAASTATTAVSEWTAREQAALEARASAGSLIDPETGLLKGLDGGDYEPYKVSTVERVQERLRTLGLYAGPADGVFGAPLREAVGSFQEQEGLPASGVPSPITRSRLFAD